MAIPREKSPCTRLTCCMEDRYMGYGLYDRVLTGYVRKFKKIT